MCRWKRLACRELAWNWECVTRSWLTPSWDAEWALLGWDIGTNGLLTALPRLDLYGTMILKQRGSNNLGWGAGPEEAQSGKRWRLRSSGSALSWECVCLKGLAAMPAG